MLSCHLQLQTICAIPPCKKLTLFCNTQAFSASIVAIRGQVKGYLWAISFSLDFNACINA